MVIKDKFELLNKIPNLLNVPASSLKTYEAEENSPRHIFTFLTLKQKHIKHFSKDKIFKFIGNVQERENIKVVTFEKYPLSVTLNGPKQYSHLRSPSERQGDPPPNWAKAIAG